MTVYNIQHKYAYNVHMYVYDKRVKNYYQYTIWMNNVFVPLLRISLSNLCIFVRRFYLFSNAVYLFYFFSSSLSDWVCALTCNCHMRVLAEAARAYNNFPLDVLPLLLFRWVYVGFYYSSEFVLYFVCVRRTRKRACVLFIFHFYFYFFAFIRPFIGGRLFVVFTTSI